MTKEKILGLILCITMLITALGSNIVFALAAPPVQYKVVKITNAEDINSKNLHSYIFVYDNGSEEIAFAFKLGSSVTPTSSRSNHSLVNVEDGIITVLEGENPNIAWNLTKSKKSVSADGDYPVIQAESGTNNYQIKLTDNAWYTGMEFVSNGNGFIFTKTENDKFLIKEDNCEVSTDYISFDEYFKKAEETDAIEFDVYKVIKEYNYSSNKFLTSDEVAALDNVSVSKKVSETTNYKDTAVAEVTLSTNGTSYEKVCDIILMLDDSTSSYNSLPNNPEKTRAEVIREDALLFAKEILEINENNRISVVKFGGNITNETDVDAIGFSNKIEDIETMIGGDKAVVSHGTDYSAAFKKANEIFEEFSDSTHGKVVIFISDGVPSKYNGVDYQTYSETDDSKGVASNWLNYINETPLAEAELMKKTGTAIYTIGSLEDDYSMNYSSGYIVPAGATRDILTKIATHSANFYKFDQIETELEEILENLLKEFCYSPTDAVVIDTLTSDIDLLTKNVNEYIPKIVFKKGDTEVETITFNEDGTEAYSSLNPGVNILNGKSFEGQYISFDGNSIKWDIGQLYKYEYKLEFPIYLNKTANLFGEGDSRETGSYAVSNTTNLTYTSITSETVEKEFDKHEVSWVSKNPTNSSTENNQGTQQNNSGQGNGGSGNGEGQNSTLLKTGDSLPVILVSIIAVVVIANIIQSRKFRIASSKKNNKKPRIGKKLK